MTRFRTLCRFVLLLLVVAVPREAHALDPSRRLSQYLHRIWQTQQGLPQASIYAVAQTRDGYLWLGTQTGLIKFDGVRFTTVDALGGAPVANVWVTHLTEDAQGTLWIGTRRDGLMRVSNGTLRRFTTKDGLPSDTVQCLFAGPSGVWACTPNGLVEITGDSVRVFGTAAGLTDANVAGACEGSTGVVLAAAGNVGVGRLEGIRFVHAAPLPASSTVQTMLCATDGSTWIGASDGLFHVEDGIVDRMTVADGLADASVLTLMESRDGAIFAGTTNGFSRIRGYDIESFRSQDGLSQSTVYSLYEDREGSVWVATKHGLNQFVDGLTIPYTTSEGLPSNLTGPVLQDRNGIVWVGTLGGGLGRYDGHRFTTLTTRNGLASNVIYASALDGGGDLWIGTAAGLNRLHDGVVVGTWTKREGLPDNTVRALFRDRDDVLWIATPAGSAVIRHGRLEPADQAVGARLAGEPIAAFGQDRAGHQYAGPDAASPLLRRADTIYQDERGLLWIGTLGDGLRLLEHGRVFSFSVQDGLFDDVIYGVVSDDHGRLWMACSKGIFSVNRDDLLQFAAGTLHHITSTPYSPLDALRTIECQPGVQPVVTRMADGRLWFSTIRGVLVIDPNHLTRHFLPPAVAVDSVIVNGERQPPGAMRTLQADRNNVEFGYAAMSFIAPTRLTFRYRLEGFDKTWVDAGSRREAFYTNLPPGRFRFRVSACNPGGACAEASDAVAFVIEPHYYQRVWFLPSCIVVLALAGWSVYGLRIRRLRAQFDLVLAERGRIARELHDTLIQGFSGITMAMQALASRLPTSEARTILEDIVGDAGRSLRDARRSITTLRNRSESPSNLAAAVERAARTLTDAEQLQLRLTMLGEQGELPAEVEYNVLRIAQEAMVNAVRHSGARTLNVTLESTRHQLRLLVNDDGHGFDHEGEAPRGHYGLVGMQERAAQIGAAFELTSQRGRGTSVSLRLET